MHVVREDPEQEGLLYTGTLQGAYVSFDQGKHWQSLQQNLPATSVTDLKVHHGDLLASTMGRSFWIMDDVAPLRQIAASITKSTRTRSTDSPNQASAPSADVVRASMQTLPAAPKTSPAPSRRNSPPASGGGPLKPAIKPFEPNANVFLFTPAATYRTHYVPSSGRPDMPEYPPVGARIDYYLASVPPPGTDLKLDILDATGKTVRSYTSEARTPAPSGRGGRRGGALPSTLPTKQGMNRFVWDLRYPGGPATGGDGEGGGFSGAGPLAPPGTYRARLTAGGATRTETFTVKIDPRVAKDGVTTADLVEQTKFALKIRDLLAEARQLSQRVRQALDQKHGDQARLQSLVDRLVTKSGPYEDQMFIDQVSNVSREIGQADQKVGASAYERFNDLQKDWTSIKADAEAALR
jgi:hypothetical protein